MQAKASFGMQKPSLGHQCATPSPSNHCPATSWLSPQASSHSLPFQSARHSTAGTARSFPLNGNSIAALLHDSSADLQAKVPRQPRQSASMDPEFEKQVHAQMPWLSSHARTLSPAASPKPPPTAAKLTQRLAASKSVEEDAWSDDSIVISPGHRQVWDWTHGPLQNFRALRRAHSDQQEPSQLPQDLPQRQSSIGDLQLHTPDSNKKVYPWPWPDLQRAQQAQQAQQAQSLTSKGDSMDCLSGQQATLSEIAAVQVPLQLGSSSALHLSQLCSPASRQGVSGAAQQAMPQLNSSSPCLQSLLPGCSFSSLQQLCHTSCTSLPFQRSQHYSRYPQPTQRVSHPSSSACHSSASLLPQHVPPTSSAASQLSPPQTMPPCYPSATPPKPRRFDFVPLHAAPPPASALQHQARVSPSKPWTAHVPPPWPLAAGDANPSPARKLMARGASPSPHRDPLLGSQHASQHAADNSNRHTGRPDSRVLAQGDGTLCGGDKAAPCGPQLQDLELQQASFDWMTSQLDAVSGTSAQHKLSQL